MTKEAKSTIEYTLVDVLRYHHILSNQSKTSTIKVFENACFVILYFNPHN